MGRSVGVSKRLIVIAAPEVYASLQQVLNAAELDYAVDHFFDSESFLQLISQKNGQPDSVLLMDQQSIPNDHFFFKIIRNTHWHHVPIVMFDSKLSVPSLEFKKSLERFGITQTLGFPPNPSELKELLHKVFLQLLDPEDLAEIDLGFVEDTSDQLNQARELIRNLNEQTGTDFFRTLHTIKGGARSLQLPELALLMHDAESALAKLKEAQLYQWQSARQFFEELLDFTLGYLVKLKAKETLPEIPMELRKKSVAIRLFIESGLRAPDLKTSSSEAPALPIEAARTEEQKSSSVRISNEKMDDLQGRFKKIQQTRVKLTSFAQMLKSEFSDEGFPNELIGLIQRISDETSSIFEFFVSLRVVSASRLKTFAQRVTAQAADTAKKEVELKFLVDETLEIDQAVVEVLEAGMTHILRNAVDHGIEKAASRQEVGKSPQGTIFVDIQKEGRERFVVTIQDDGGGISIEGLKRAVAKGGALPLDQINAMNDVQALDLVFVDGLSTKEEVSELSGRGVGLGAVKKRIEDLNGTIEVVSEKGKGSTFKIQMPRIFQL